MTPNRPVSVLFSGGVDSAACAHFFKAQNRPVRAIFVDFGQPAAPDELRAVERLSSVMALEVRSIKVDAGRNFDPGEIPGRNAFLITTAVLLDACASELIAIGVHAGTGYYDCSAGFIKTMERVVSENTEGATSLIAPFLSWSKAAVFDYYLSAGLQPDASYSCERGGIPVCGLCNSCRDRLALDAR